MLVEIHTPGASKGGFFVELDFPTDTIADFNSVDISQISGALNGASIIDIKRAAIGDDLLVLLTSGEAVAETQEDIEAIAKCPGGGYLLLWVLSQIWNQRDTIAGSARCALAPYWSKKLGKCDPSAYAASPRGGVVHNHTDEQKHRILMRGKAVTVMEGRVLI